MNKKLHILFLSSWYPSKVSPTSGTFVQRHAEAVATKHKVTVVFPIGDKNLKNSYSVEKKNVKNVNTVIIYFKSHPKKYINVFRKYRALLLGLKNVENYDIIHGNVLYPIGIFTILLSLQKKKPYIFTEHWTGYLPNSKIIISYTKKHFTKFIVKKAKFIIPVSLELQNAMQQIGFIGNYQVIGNVVNTNIFHPQVKTNKKFTIAHVSTLKDPHKNITGLLNVIHRLSKNRNDFIFKIIGEKNSFELQKKINSLNFPKNLIYVEGLKNEEEIALILNNSNLYISFSNYETFGIVMAESLACGTPVISTKTGILNELNITEFFNLIPIGDEEALFNCITQYLNTNQSLDTHKMHSIIKNNFSIDSIASKYSEIYSKSLNI